MSVAPRISLLHRTITQSQSQSQSHPLAPPPFYHHLKCKCISHHHLPLTSTSTSTSGHLRLVPAALSIDIQKFYASPSPSSDSGAFKVLDGMPHPLGATACDGGINFALYSSSASTVSLCLFTLDDLKENKATEVIVLDPESNKTGHI